MLELIRLQVTILSQLTGSEVDLLSVHAGKLATYANRLVSSLGGSAPSSTDPERLQINAVTDPDHFQLPNSASLSPCIPKTVSNHSSSSVENAENFKPIHSSKGKELPTEIGPDSLETAYYNKLLSSNPPDSHSGPRIVPNLSNNEGGSDSTLLDEPNWLDIDMKHHNLQLAQEKVKRSRQPLHSAYDHNTNSSSSQNELRKDKVKDDNGPQKNHKPNDDMDIPGRLLLNISIPEPWECPHCTYVNHAEGNICEICAKSRGFKFDEEIPTLKLDTETLKGSSGAAKPSSSQPSPILRSHSSISRSASSNSNREETITRPPKESPASVSSDQIACPQCTYLNPKTRVLCEVCDCRLRQGAQ
ncbi:unnamed protein product [Allacma fusca]|uniref:RanBP2-type domain-containing protein n=1 Tax=Allacma fusca TaxID=39272 RepID=A0A8J2JA73_9HEXA|nr:unnamed protein product [Allacma fusca]